MGREEMQARYIHFSRANTSHTHTHTLTLRAPVSSPLPTHRVHPPSPYTTHSTQHTRITSTPGISCNLRFFLPHPAVQVPLADAEFSAPAGSVVQSHRHHPLQSCWPHFFRAPLFSSSNSTSKSQITPSHRAPCKSRCAVHPSPLRGTRLRRAPLVPNPSARARTTCSEGGSQVGLQPVPPSLYITHTTPPPQPG